MGGMAAVVRNFNPDVLWVGNNPRFAAYDALLDEAAGFGARVRSLRAGDALSLGSLQIAVLAPFANYQPGVEPSNNDSLVLHAAYGSTSVMLEGDAEAPIEQAMLSELGLESTLLKVGHHGSITSTMPEFLARVVRRGSNFKWPAQPLRASARGSDCGVGRGARADAENGPRWGFLLCDRW